MEIITVKNVNAYIENDIAYLKLADVARGLGITQLKNGIEYIRWDRLKEYLKDFNFPTCGESDFIPENIFYKLCMKANNDVARKFQDLVADEILPSIRKHGAYMTNDTLEKALTSPDFLIQLATNLKIEKEKNKMLTDKIETDRPKVIFAEALAVSEKSILIGELAKILKQNGIEIGANRLFEWLRANNYLMAKGESRNQPSQKSMNLKLMEIKKTTINNSDGSVRVTVTTKITPKGQEYFINKFLKNKELIEAI